MRPDLKVLFAGPMGAGKTTAIRTISDIEPLLTEQPNSQQDVVKKATTTVAMDYGEVVMESGQRLLLYGAPGQRRFDFMWKTLSNNALGMVILLNDNHTGIPELNYYLEAFSQLLLDIPIVIGLSRLNESARVRAYQQCLQKHHRQIPIMPVDVRKRADVLVLLELLFTQIETEQCYGKTSIMQADNTQIGQTFG